MINSVFWTCFTLYRIPCIVINKRIGNERGVLLNVVLMVISCGILVPLGEKYLWALWTSKFRKKKEHLTNNYATGMVIMGIGASAIFAALLGYFAEHFEVTGGQASLYLVMACLGEFVVPFIIGSVIDQYPRVFIYTVTWCIMACFVLYLVIIYLIRTKLRRND